MKNKIYKSLFLGISTAVVATASYALISPENKDSAPIKTALILPTIQPTSTPVGITLPVTSSPTPSLFKPKFKTISYEIKKGENLSVIFSKLNLHQIDLHKIIFAEDKNSEKQFQSILPKKELIALTDSKNQLQKLVYKKSAISSITATRSNNTFDIKVVNEPIEKRTATIQATIKSSLFLDGKEAGFSNKLIMQLAEIFGWDIDFALNLRQHDQITVVYEELYVNGKEFGTGNILSAEFVNQGHSFTAVRFEDDQGNAGYYTPDGNSMRKAFLRTPVDFARISSHFNLKRKHPVLNRIRAHKGVDYAARTGTAIKTTGDGKIVYRGRKGGYGRVVIVQHGQKYSTLYAHLSKYKKGQKVGSYVKQGKTIGYVGKSGLATGPHLHYEFLVNGTHRNPLTVKLPHAQPVKKSQLAQFKKQTQPLIAQLDRVKSATLLAHNKQ